MRALTIRQPWLFAIERLGKSVENRSWPVPPQAVGTVVALHAGKTMDWDAEFPDGADWRGKGYSLRLGGITSIARIAGCHPRYHICNRTGIPQTVCTPWSIWGQFHWLLEDVRPLAEPVPCRGALGLWTVPEEAERAVRAQLEATP